MAQYKSRVRGIGDRSVARAEGIRSFGTYPKSVRARLQRLQDEAEERPDIYIRISHVKYLNESRHLLAKYLNAPPSSIVLQPNATTALNTILRNLVFHEHDTIICFSTTYGAVVKTLLSIAETTPVAVTSIPLTTQAALSNASILAAVESTVLNQRAAGLNPRALMLDAIVSEPGIRMPFEALVSLCRRLGIYSVVDGAHTIGMIPLDLTALDADFFVTNAHKWLYVPRACAIMYVPQRNQALIRTSFPTSANFVPNIPPGKLIPPVETAVSTDPEDNTPFVKLFEYTGTLNSQAYNCVGEALRFRERVCGGEEATQRYVYSIASRGAQVVAKMLGTEILDNKEGTLHNGLALVNVRLPIDLEKVKEMHNAAHPQDIHPEQDSDVVPAWVQIVRVWIATRFIEEYNTSVPIIWWGNAFWTRLSGQIYLDLSDFEAIARQFRVLCGRVSRGDHLKD